MNLPKELKLSPHAKQRLEERKDDNMKYNIQNIMRSSVKWYNKDDLIYDCALYRHCCYTIRKSNQLSYITDGDIEIIYNKNTHVVVTVLEVKEKFKPIIQFIKPTLLEKIKTKKENKKMKKEVIIGTCPDCGKTDVDIVANGMYIGLCQSCKQRKQNAKARKREYIPYIDLSESEKKRIDSMKQAQNKSKLKRKEITIPEVPKTIPVVENYYQVKAENNPSIAHIKEIPTPKSTNTVSLLADENNFIKTLRDCGCEIPQDDLENVLDVLMNTDKLKNIFMTIAKSSSQQAMLDLEQALNVVERKLQHDWEFNGFQEADDIKFKEFLTWRRILKGAIFFWKKLYQTNTIIEMERAWNAYTQDPNDKILLAGDRIDSAMKRFQITTESISTIFNTKRPFTRVFYATDENIAYNMFKQWMADRNLHENKAKTKIVELKNEGKNPVD